MQQLLADQVLARRGLASCELALEDPRFDDLQAVLHYWQGLRRGRLAPARSEVEPEPLKQVLDRLMIIEVGGRSADAYRFRLAGSRLYDLYGEELTGSTLADVRPPAFSELLQRDYAEAVARRSPTLWLVAAQRQVRPFALGCLVLPLSDDGVRIDRLLSVVSEGPGIYRLLYEYQESVGS